MAKEKFSEKSFRTELRDFDGVVGDPNYENGNCDRIENFRVDPLGVLIKRPGREKISELYARAYSVLPCSLGAYAQGPEDVVIAAPPYVYTFNTELREGYRLLDDASVEYEPVGLAAFSSGIYLFDGSRVRIYDDAYENFRDCEGYAPLYGKDWDPSSGGPIYEEPNLLGGLLRINYKTTTDVDRLYLGFEATDIIHLEVNGYEGYEYYLDGYGISGYFPGESSIDVCVRVPCELGEIVRCRSICKVGGGSSERLIAYNASYYSSAVFCSRPVSPEELERSYRMTQGQGDGLYFPASLRLTPCDGGVRAIAPCGDKFVLFTETNARLGVIGENGAEIYQINRDIGCVEPRATFTRGQSVYTIAPNGICRLDVDLDDPYDTKAEIIFSAPEGWGDFYEEGIYSIFENPSDGELWFSVYGQILIYNTKNERFYVYTGMMASYGRMTTSGLVIFDERKIFRFSDYLYHDIDGNYESPIRASFRTRWTDLGESETEKHSLTLHPVFTLDGGSDFSLSVETDSGCKKTFAVTANAVGASDAPDHRSVRVARCRFKSTRFTLTSSGRERLRLFSVVLTAKGSEK